MKKIYFLLFVALTFSSMLSAQIELFNLGGGGAFPAGWTDTNNVTTNNIDKSTYYLLDAGSPGDEIISETVDLSSYATADFSVDIRSFDSGNHIETVVEISYDGGATYTESTLSPITTTGFTTFTYSLMNVSNQVVIRLKNNGSSNADRGIRMRNIKLVGNSSDPFISITGPNNNQVFAAGTTSVDVVIDVQNFNVAAASAGDGFIKKTLVSPGGTFLEDKFDVLDDAVAVADGENFTITFELVDNAGMSLNPVVSSTVDFSVSFPCDLQIGTITTTCDTETTGTDTYTTTIEFTGGNTSTYTLDTGGVGTISGDNPSTSATGTIIISNVNEGVDFSINFSGLLTNSGCDFNRSITSPACLPAITCPNVGSLIITEIMKNPSAVDDDLGEYFEVYNTTSSAIDMIGLVISDQGSDSHTIGSSVIVPANGYVVLGRNDDTDTNGDITVDYEYSGIVMSNGTDEIQIVCSGTTIDLVAYSDAAFPDTAGAAMELSATALNSTDNDDGANWGNAINDIGSGDLGTPGDANGFTLSVQSIDANTTFSVYPNPVNNGFVNITSQSNATITATVFDVLGKQVLNANLTNNRLNVSNLRAGIYILNINQNGTTSTKKLVVK